MHHLPAAGRDGRIPSDEKAAGGVPSRRAAGASAALSAVLISFLACAARGAGDGPEWIASHGITLYGAQDLKYGRDEPYEFVNTNAPKGGTLNLVGGGPFTKFNRFTIEGVMAPGEGLVFESLAEQSIDDDEPVSMYGRLADRFEMTADRLMLKVHINPKARFSDRRAVTADDVVFTFGLVREPSFSPMLKMALEDIEKTEKLDDLTVLFKFKKFNRELPTWVGGLPILPKHVYDMPGKDFAKDYDDVVPAGSGPYTVESFEKSSFVSYRKNPDWWAADLPKCRGRFNFEKVKLHLFLDDLPWRQMLKNGDIDAADISSSKDWQFEFNGENFRKNYAVRRALQNRRVAGMQCFVFNLRRPKFQDIRVRKAISSVFDFEFMNRNLFYDQYTRLQSFWDNSPEMTDRGPATGAVRRILTDLRAKHNTGGRVFVPREAITRGPYVMGADRSGAMLPQAARIRAANEYLDSLGWKFDRRKQARSKDGLDLSFEIVMVGTGFQRVCNPFIEALREIGVNAKIRIVQPAEYNKLLNAFDYDVVIMSGLGGNTSPGYEQRDMWTSASADVPGSFNVLGLRNPAVDELVDRIVGSNSRLELVENTKALDRLLCANHYVIPHWYVAADRVVYWNRFGHPDRYAGNLWGVNGVAADHWWFDAGRDAALREAMKTGAVFEGGDKSEFKPAR